MRKWKQLDTKTVAALKRIGRHADGNGLYLSISRDGSKKWVLMYAREGRRREAGLGSARSVTLAEARGKAAEYRSLLTKGIDPLDAKKAAREAVERRRTFGQCADALVEAKRDEWTVKQAAQWASSLNKPCAVIRNRPVDAIDTAAVLEVLQPMWGSTYESASRLRGRIEAVLDAAKVQGFRSGENPARWRGHLDKVLAKRGRTRTHHAAMLYAAVPDFVAMLRVSPELAARALELIILMATRLSEVRAATFDEFGADVWTIPAARMLKTGVEHRVPLSKPARDIVLERRNFSTCKFLFQGRSGRQPIDGQTIRKLVPAGATIHGFRSAFRDWAGDCTAFPREIAEAALAHQIGNAVEQAYRRGDALEKRRQLMDAWADYITCVIA